MNPDDTLLSRLQLDTRHVALLPPEVRDMLLEFLDTWASPDELLTLTGALREAHGPLLFLLDYEASALLRQGKAAEALDSIERRQRRSATISGQLLEARALLALNRPDHARSIALDVGRTYRRNPAAVTTAAEILAEAGHPQEADELLSAYLEQRPGDIQANLSAAHLASSDEAADTHLQRLGAGIPAGISDQQLRRLLSLYERTGSSQSAAAARLELEHRRQVQFQRLEQALQPLRAADITPLTDISALYQQLSGPDSIPVERGVRRRIQLDAVRHFGFMRLREGQVETIAAVLRGESILTVMPTGGGKSLCYQLPALVLPRASLVISPLIALMKDQVEGLPAAARRQATFINSTLSDTEMETRMQGIRRGEYKLIYAAPERLRQISFLRALRSAGLDLFVVDEAHCVSLWGHDFRPDYLFIQEARRALGSPPALAMTATAPPRVRDEIVDYISDDPIDGPGDTPGDTPALSTEPPSSHPRVMALDIFRSNIHLSALNFHSEDEKLVALLKFVSETPGSGIVYVNSRRRAESLAFELRKAGIAAEAYHAGMEDRGAVQDRFMSDKTRVVVATIAFGMGIDKSDIRFIVHFHPSRSLDAYYQEVGRAGRDGKPSQGVLFYSNNDWANLRRWAKADEISVDSLKRVYAAIATQLGLRLDEQAEFQVPAADDSATGLVDARRLQQVLNTDEVTVRVALSMLERVDLLDRGFDLPQECEIRIEDKLPQSARNDAAFVRFLKGLALGPGQAAAFKSVDIASFMDWPVYEIETRLLDWHDAGYIAVDFARRAMHIELTTHTGDIDARLDRLLAQNAAMAQRRIDDMVGYATADRCRHGYISAHFGSPPRTNCGVCDICTGIRPDIPSVEHAEHILPDDSFIEPMIIDCLMSLPRPVGRSGLARILAGSLRAPATPDQARHHGSMKAAGEATIMEYIDELLEQNRLRQYERQGYLVLAATMQGRAEAEAWLAEHPELNQYAPAPEAQPEAEPDAPSEAEKYTALQRALWLWRRRVAEQQGQPPYMIMTNELILRIAEQRPQTIEELAQLPGMGSQRLDHYGPSILDIVQLNPAQPQDAELLSAQRMMPADGKPATAPSPPDPRLARQVFLKLQEMRQKKAVSQRTKPHLIASTTLLKAISEVAPDSVEALERIHGFAGSGLQGDAQTIVEMIATLAAANAESADAGR